MIGSAEVFEADNFPSQLYDSDNLADISTDFTDEENNTEEGNIEILRSSPPPSRKGGSRAQVHREHQPRTLMAVTSLDLAELLGRIPQPSKDQGTHSFQKSLDDY